VKLTALSIAALFAATTAQAGPFGLPDHVQDGFRDTGCPVETRYKVEGTNYYSNKGCPEGSAAVLVDEPTDPETPVDPEPETPVDPAPPVDEPTDPETPDDGGPVVTPDPVDPPVDDPAPECRGDCNNGHGNDEDGDDEGNPGKSK